jgi:anti-sigma regulatory factor (Ser/Thr protein kinase)
MGRCGSCITEIQMPSSPAECSRLRKVVTRLASAGLRPTAAEEMELALGEAISNAVKYGESDAKISVRVESLPDREVAVELDYPDDQFDACIKCPDDLRNATGGFGRFIIQQVTDSMEYSFQDGHTRLRMTKRC